MAAMDSQLLWENIRHDARKLEQQLDDRLGRLEDLAKVDERAVLAPGETEGAGPSGGGSLVDPYHNSNVFATTSSSAAASHGKSHADAAAAPRRPLARIVADFDAAAHDVDATLQQLEQTVRTMQERGASLPPASSALRVTERFQSVATEKRRTLQRLQADFRRRRERLELVPNVQRDLKAYGDDAGVRLLMEEQQALRHTAARVNNILEEASETHGAMRRQRERFDSMGDRLVQIAERVPVIQSVLRRVDARRRRHVVILGLVIGLCLLLTVVFF